MRIFLLVSFMFLTWVSWAQEENVREKKKERIRALTEQKKRKLDSLQNVFQQIGSTIKIDSLSVSVQEDTLSNGFSTDSLFRIKQALANRTDSLSLQNQADSLSNRIEQLSDNLQKKVDSIGFKVTDKINKLDQNVSDKIQRTINDKTGEQVEIPGLDRSGLPDPGKVIPNIDPALDLKLPETQLPNLNLDTSLPDIPAIAKPTIPDLSIPELNLPNTDVLQNLKNLPSIDSISVKDLSDLSTRLGIDSTKILESIGIEDRWSPYLNQFDSLSVDNLKTLGMDGLEAFAETSKPVQELSGELQRANAVIAEQEAMLQRYRDKKLLLEEIKRKSGNVANDVINPLSDEFKQAQEQIAKARKLNPAVQSFTEIVRKRPNEMKGKPFYERLVPGIALQPFNSTEFAFDVAPFLAYRFTGRWSAGLGGVYRIAVNSDNQYYVGQGGVYGFRSFVDFNALKGFYVHSELEHLHLDYEIKPPAETEFQQQTWNGYVGIGKLIPLTRKVNTTVTALYRIEFKGYLPGASHFGIRMGFTYVTKKVRKPTALE